MYELGDTIVAVATAPGLGAVGIVRLSGPQALAIASRLWAAPSPLPPRRSLRFGSIQDPLTGDTVDEGLALVMPGPQSSTGEDVVELQVHGSPAVLAKLLALLTQAGARAALPGEFTYRAFRNGRLDLSQAEAVQALVAAQGEASRRQALRQLTGGLSAFLEPVEEKLKALYLQIEARLEFAEDGIPELDRPKFQRAWGECLNLLQKLLESYGEGRVLQEGLVVALVGAPNVGKSSLLNALLGRDRAIVTPIAGTTRDAVEGEMVMAGVRVRFFDTAGLRKSGDRIEAEGVRRSRKILEEADLALWVLDASRPLEGLVEAKDRLQDPKTWFLVNKVDLAPPDLSGLPADRSLAVSCVSGQGLDELKGRLAVLAPGETASSDVVLTQERHRREIAKAVESLESLGGLMETREPWDKWAEELREAILAVGRVRGRDLPQEAFEEIFSRFCIGK